MSEQSLKSYKLLENIIFLKKASLFSSVQTGDLRAVAAILEEITFEAGEIIVKENDVGDSMYIIKDGSVTINKDTGGNSNIVLAELGVGECFGDMSVFDTELRSATVTSKERCVMLRLNRDDLHDVMLDYPNMSVGMLKVFVNRLRKANAKIKELSEKLIS